MISGDSYSQQSSDEGSDRNSQVSQQCSEDVDMRDEQYDELNLGMLNIQVLRCRKVN